MINIPHVAKLAALRLDPAELPVLQQEMEELVLMVQHLPECTALPCDGGPMQLREDRIVQSECTPEELLQNAPAVCRGCAAVPRTVQ